MGGNTLIGIFIEAVDTHRRADQFMRRRADGWESIAAERALADVEALALSLRALGIARGDRVALLSENRYEWAISDLAILGLGAVTVPIYPTLTAAQCRALLQNSEAKAIIVSSPAQQEKVRSVAGELPALRMRIGMDSTPGTPRTGEHTLAAVLESGARLRESQPAAFRDSAAAVQPEDLATIIYTSGTTGEPKGAMLTHGNIASNIVASLQVLQFRSTDRSLSFLPLCHIFERMAGFYAILACGASIAYAQNFETVGSDALEVRPTVLIGVPRFFEKARARILTFAGTLRGPARALFAWGLARGLEKARAHDARKRLSPWAVLQARIADRLVARKIRARLGGRLRFCISGSAPLAVEVLEFFHAIGVPIIEGYGLTETSPVISFNPPGREKQGTVGPPIPGIEVRIGAEGEIQTRGPHVMRGYFHNDDATREALRDGWFHTGDIGHLDAEGYLVITDRLKDLLVLAGGKKVAPQPLETKLKTSPWISEAILLGDRRPYVVGLLIPDFVALEAEAKARGWSAAARRELLDRPEVRTLYQGAVDRLNGDLAPFEQIKRFALLDRDLSQENGELTPSLKVKRRVIAERFAPRIEELYAGHVPAVV